MIFQKSLEEFCGEYSDSGHSVSSVVGSESEYDDESEEENSNNNKKI